MVFDIFGTCFVSRALELLGSCHGLETPGVSRALGCARPVLGGGAWNIQRTESVFFGVKQETSQSLGVDSNRETDLWHRPPGRMIKDQAPSRWGTSLYLNGS